MLHPALTENRLLFNIGHLEKNIFRSNGGPVMPSPSVIANIRFQRRATSLARDVTASKSIRDHSCDAADTLPSLFFQFSPLTVTRSAAA